MASDTECELELPPDLEDAPGGWVFQHLRNLVSEGRGISYGLVQPGSHTERGVPIVRVNNIVSGRLTAAESRTLAALCDALPRTNSGLSGELRVPQPSNGGWLFSG